MAQKPANLTNWQPMIPVDQSIYEESTTQQTKLGTEIVVGERKFRYAKAGANLSAGDVVASPANTQVVNATCGTGAVAGTYQAYIYGAAAISAGVFNEGYLIAADATGQGYTYRIKSQPAVATTTNQLITLYDPLVADLGAASEVTCVPNKYNGVTNVINGTTPVAGVAPVTVTSGNYFWAQYAGPASVKVNTTVAYGSRLVPATTGGCTLVDATANAQFIGTALAAATTADNAPVYLSLCDM